VTPQGSATGRHFARHDLVEYLCRLIISRRPQDRPLRIGIDGVDAAGKTTLAEELALVLATKKCPVLRASIDGFHRPRPQRLRRGEASPAGFYLDSFDYPALRRELLDPLGPGGSGVCRSRVYDARREAPVESSPQRIGRDVILLFDGIFLQRPELADAWDLVIFLVVNFDEVLRRARARDAERFGSATTVTARYRTRYIPGEKLYLATCHPEDRADVVIDNNVPASPVLLRAPRRAAPSRRGPRRVGRGSR
jgi:uridine kinase